MSKVRYVFMPDAHIRTEQAQAITAAWADFVRDDGSLMVLNCPGRFIPITLGEEPLEVRQPRARIAKDSVEVQDFKS